MDESTLLARKSLMSYLNAQTDFSKLLEISLNDADLLLEALENLEVNVTNDEKLEYINELRNTLINVIKNDFKVKLGVQSEKNYKVHFLEPQFLISLVLVKLKRRTISNFDFNHIRVGLSKKLSALGYQFLYSDRYLDLLKINYPEYFELSKTHIHSKVALDTLCSRFVAYLPNEVLKIVFDDYKGE